MDFRDQFAAANSGRGEDIREQQHKLSLADIARLSRPLPTALVGRACGQIKGSRHVNFPDRTPLANVLLTMLQRTGVNIDKVGDSTGAIAEI